MSIWYKLWIILYIYHCSSFNGLMNRMVVFPKFTAFLQHKEIFTLNCEHFIHSSRDACTARALTVGTVRAVRHCPALSELRQSDSPRFYYYAHLLRCLCTREQSDGSGSQVSSYPRTTGQALSACTVICYCYSYCWPTIPKL